MPARPYKATPECDAALEVVVGLLLVLEPEEDPEGDPEGDPEPVEVPVAAGEELPAVEGAVPELPLTVTFGLMQLLSGLPWMLTMSV